MEAGEREAFLILAFIRMVAFYFGFWAADPKGTKSCRTQGESVRTSVRPPPLEPLRGWLRLLRASAQASQSLAQASQSLAQASQSLAQASQGLAQVAQSLAQVSQSLAQVSQSLAQVLQRKCQGYR